MDEQRAPRSGEPEHERARGIVLRHGWNPAAYQILNPGMRLWFSRAGDAVAGYAVHARTWVVAGAPVAPRDRLTAVADEMEAAAAATGHHVVYFGAGARLERVVTARGGGPPLLLGAQPVWDAAAWPAIVRRKASLRAQLNRARHKGVAVREWPAPAAQGHPSLRRVLHEWLATRGLPPLHFMTEPDTLDDLRDRRIFVAERGGDVVAFLVATPVPARHGWLLEQWPRATRAPNGTTHLLVDTAIRALGASYVTLGLAPLSNHAGPVGGGQPAWLRGLLVWARAHGRRFYNFRGLDAFKASLAPQSWEPIWVLPRDGRFRLGTLRAVAGVFSGGSPERLVVTALWMAVKRELRRATGTGREAG